MPSLIDIRRRIRSVKNTQQITKAMKMVSAAKLRRAQDRMIASRPYGALLRKVLGNVAAAVAGDEHAAENPLLARRPEQRILLVLITGDKGLAGAFNTNLIKGAQRFAAERPGVAAELRADRPQGPRFLPQARRRRSPASTSAWPPRSRYDDTAAIARKAMELFRNDEIDAVYLIYNEFKSVSTQKLTVARVLPAELPEQAAPVDYIFEEPPAEMLQRPAAAIRGDGILPRAARNRRPASMPRA